MDACILLVLRCHTVKRCEHLLMFTVTAGDIIFCVFSNNLEDWVVPSPSRLKYAIITI